VSHYAVNPTNGALTLNAATVSAGQGPLGIAVTPLAGLGVELPTTKNECMRGGWNSFGTVFKNQGDCVAFVAAGGKNPPNGA
jgi:hypothetical protein